MTKQKESVKKHIQVANEAFNSDAKNLKRKLQKEEEVSLLKANRNDYPRDKEGKAISDKKVKEFVMPIAGKGTETPIKDIKRITTVHGGKPSNWSKDTTIVSELAKKSDRTDERHSYKNQTTGKTVEIKVKEYLPKKVSEPLKEKKEEVIKTESRSSESKKFRGR